VFARPEEEKEKKLGENGFPLHQDMNPTPFEYDAGVLKILPHCVVFGVLQQSQQFNSQTFEKKLL
jgi:hypothetical protein